MLISFFRAVLLYLILVAVIRLMGKRQLGEMEPSEFVVSMLIADLASVPMQDIGIPLLSGVIPILTVLALELVLTTLSLHSLRIRRILCGNPVVLMDDGRILEKNLRRTRITVDELLELLRQSGTVDLQQIWQATLETNGQVSVLLRAEHMPASAKDAGIQVKQIAVPVSIISDGKVLRRNLEALGHDRAWLDEQLRQRKMRVKDVFLFTQEPGGKQYWLPREGLK